MRYSDRARKNNVKSGNCWYIKNNVFERLRTIGRNHKRSSCLVGVGYLDPDLLNNIQEANLKGFVDWAFKLERDYTTGFVSLPLSASARLLNDQYIVVVSCKLWCAVSRTVHSLRRIEQAWVAIRSVPTRSGTKLARGQAQAVLLPL